MTEDEKNIIYRFAMGEFGLREYAVYIHRKHLRGIGPRGNTYQRFMAEVDHPCPDIGLRNTYKEQLIKEHGRI